MNPYVYNNKAYPYSKPYNQDDRFAGGFLGPFVLGGITGGLLAPAFYPRPYQPYPAPPPAPYPYQPYPPVYY